MSVSDDQLLMVQTMVGRVVIFILAPMIFCFFKISGYHIRDLEKTRDECRKYFKGHQGPWLICANHLTMIDSLILAYAMMPIYQYTFRFNLIPWNVPEKKNFQRNIFSSMICYSLKCIPISRGGNRDRVKATLNKCMVLLQKHQNLMIFPEGTRSRTGYICTRDFPYGVGRLLNGVPECKVLCIYARGDHQRYHSTLPRYKEVFSVKTEVIRPVTKMKGLKAQRDISGQIIRHLFKMENNYFAEHRK
jgi:1-acyl-sn-glycerol-3-phosphate acyltransferase